MISSCWNIHVFIYVPEKSFVKMYHVDCQSVYFHEMKISHDSAWILILKLIFSRTSPCKMAIRALPLMAVMNNDLYELWLHDCIRPPLPHLKKWSMVLAILSWSTGIFTRCYFIFQRCYTCVISFIFDSESYFLYMLFLVFPTK